MDLAKYSELTGKIISESQQAFYTACLNRAIAKLEALLGWSFTPQAPYKELGKSSSGCICSNIPKSLLPPDEVEGIIQIFPYNYKDKFLMVNPFKEVYKVKLVKTGADKQFITQKMFESYDVKYIAEGIGKYIERCETCFCDCDCKDCVQLAVDADWLDWEDAPLELLYLLCDMVDWQADPTRDIKSESVDGHSWSKGDVKAPETEDVAIRLLARYAGPFGTITRVPTL